MNDNFDVTFTATSPYRYTGSHFRRKRHVQLVEYIITHFLPFPLNYPVKITVSGTASSISQVTFYSDTQYFRFSEPCWREGSVSYAFGDIYAESHNDDGVSKKVMHIYQYGMYFFGKVLLNEVLAPKANPFQNFLLIFNDTRPTDAKHYSCCKEIVFRLCDFLRSTSSFTYFDVLNTVMAVFNMNVGDIDILNIEGVLSIFHGKLVLANTYFDDALVECYFSNGKCEATCRTPKSVLTAYPDGCLAFRCDLENSGERNAELYTSLEKIDKAKKHLGFMPTN